MIQPIIKENLFVEVAKKSKAIAFGNTGFSALIFINALKILNKLKSINIVLADQAMVSGVNFLTGVLLARYLGLSEFGVFSLAWVAILLANTLQMALIISPMMSIGSKQAESEAPVYFGAVLAQQIIFGGLSFVLLFVGVKLSGVFFPQWEIETLALPLATVAVVFQMQDFFRRFFFTKRRLGLAFTNDAVKYLGQIILLIFLVNIVELSAIGALWAITATSAIAVILGTLSVGPIKFRRKAFSQILSRHWHFSFWIASSSVFQWVGSQGVIVIAGGVLGSTSIGGIRAVLNLTAVTNILMLAVQNVIPIEASRYLAKQGKDKLVTYLSRVALLLGVSTIVIGILAIVFKDRLLEFLYGNDYRQYAYLVFYQAAYVFIGALIVPISIYFKAIECTKIISNCSVVAALLSVIAGSIFLWIFNNEEAVFISLIINQLVTLGLLYYFFQNKTSLKMVTIC